MTSVPAEFYALGNAFLFALHNLFVKKALRYSNPATAVICSLLMNIVFLWGVSVLFVPLSSLTSASILIFVIVGLFQPGLTRLLTYKGIDALGVAITDPIRATTPLFSAMMAIIFLGEENHSADHCRHADDHRRDYIAVMAKRLDEACGFGFIPLVPDCGFGARRGVSGRAKVRARGCAAPVPGGGSDGFVVFGRLGSDALCTSRRRRRPGK